MAQPEQRSTEQDDAGQSDQDASHAAPDGARPGAPPGVARPGDTGPDREGRVIGGGRTRDDRALPSRRSRTSPARRLRRLARRRPLRPTSAAPAPPPAAPCAWLPAPCGAPAWCAAAGRQVAVTVLDARMTEASGLAVCRRPEGVVSTHSDSGDAPVIFAPGMDGTVRAVLTPGGGNARDWEDTAVGRDER